jgi:hypothetical protein
VAAAGGGGEGWQAVPLISVAMPVNLSERRGTSNGVDNCQQALTCKASRCLGGGIRTRRSRKLLLIVKSKVGRSDQSTVTGGAVCTAPTMIATDARCRFGARQGAPATTQGIS